MNVHRIFWNLVFVVQCGTLAVTLPSPVSVSKEKEHESSLRTSPSSTSSSFLVASLKPSSSSSSPSSSLSTSSLSSSASSSSSSPLLLSSLRWDEAATSESPSGPVASRKRRHSQRQEMQALEPASSSGIRQNDDSGSDVSESAGVPSSPTRPHRLRHNKKRHRSRQRLTSRKRRRPRKKCRKNSRSQRHGKPRKCPRRRKSKKKRKRNKKNRGRKGGRKKTRRRAKGDNSEGVVKEKIVVIVKEDEPQTVTEKPSEIAASWYSKAKPLQQRHRNESTPITTTHISLGELASNFDSRQPLSRTAENVKGARHGRSVEETTPANFAQERHERASPAQKRVQRASPGLSDLKRSSSHITRDRLSDGVSDSEMPALLTYSEHKTQDGKTLAELLRRQKRDERTQRVEDWFEESVTMSPSSSPEDRGRERRHHTARDLFFSRHSPRQRSFTLDVQVQVDFRRRS